jgi:hypothetical protein
MGRGYRNAMLLDHFLTQAMDIRQRHHRMRCDFRAFEERAIEFAKEKGEHFFALASALARANNIQEVLTLQGQYAQTQMQSYAVQAKELGGMLARVLPAYGRTIAIP